jgi:hypothetical protein
LAANGELKGKESDVKYDSGAQLFHRNEENVMAIVGNEMSNRTYADIDVLFRKLKQEATKIGNQKIYIYADTLEQLVRNLTHEIKMEHGDNGFRLADLADSATNR